MRKNLLAVCLVVGALGVLLELAVGEAVLDGLRRL